MCQIYHGTHAQSTVQQGRHSALQNKYAIRAQSFQIMGCECGHLSLCEMLLSLFLTCDKGRANYRLACCPHKQFLFPEIQ